MTFEPILTIEKPTLIEAWADLNEQMMYLDQSSTQVFRELTVLSAPTWGLRPSREMTMFYPKMPFRIKMLRTRYFEQESFDQAVKDMKELAHRSGRGYSSIAIRFDRKKVGGIDIPRGGGCLLALIVQVFKNHMELRLFIRSSECSRTLVGDIYFMEWTWRYLLQSVGEPYTRLPLTRIDFVLGSVRQLNWTLLDFLLWRYGEEEFIDLMTWVGPWPHLRFSTLRLLHVQRIFWRQCYLAGESQPYGPLRNATKRLFRHTKREVWDEVYHHHKFHIDRIVNTVPTRLETLI